MLRDRPLQRVKLLPALKKELRAAADPERAGNSAWFFKTGKGEYGEGDRFIGIRVPALRRIARNYRSLSLDEVSALLKSPIHEHRFVALEILVDQYERGDAHSKQAIFIFYLRNTQRINNWDLVDTSAPYILGEHLRWRPREMLYRLAQSENIWERRMAIIATMPFIRSGELRDTFAITALLLDDKHDLIHKAVGWMLREAGKQSSGELIDFLKQNYTAMPRTALRYAIERFPKAQRKRMLAGAFG